MRYMCGNGISYGNVNLMKIPVNNTEIVSREIGNDKGNNTTGNGN